MPTNISIQRVTIAELNSFITNPEYLSWEVIPVSRHRARSYMANTRCTASDTVLYIAYLEGKLVGYRTVLPDIIHSNGQQIKAAWLSGNWVAPTLRRKGISSQLLTEVLKDYDGNLLNTNYAPESRAVYDKSGLFQNICTLKGIRIYIRPCFSRVLAPRIPVLKKLGLLWEGIDSLLALINPIPLLIRVKGIGQGIRMEYLAYPDNEVNKLFEDATRHSPTRRGGKELEWITRFPWVVESPLGDAVAQRYNFSSGPKQFGTYLVKVYKEGELLGFILMNSNDGFLSTPYIIYQAGNEQIFARAILAHAVKIGAKRITVFEPGVKEQISKGFPNSILTIRQERNFIATKGIADAVRREGAQFLEGDGDCVFV